MKKWVWISLTALLLTACGTEQTMETISDDIVLSVAAPIREVFVALPPEAATPVLESDSGCVYICGDYEIYRQTLDAGNLSATVREVSGYNREDITVIETARGDWIRYDLVWASAGEAGDRIGKACILDDGYHHYVLSVMADAETAWEHQLVWQAMFESFCLV